MGVAPREIQENAGLFRVQYGADGEPFYRVLVDKTQNPGIRDRITAYELGHALEYFASRTCGFDSEGLKSELRTVYNDLNPDLAQARQYRPGVDPASRPVLRNYGPEAQGYSGKKVDRELWAEAIRAYMADPNYLKSVAPNVAKAIRAFVNDHPTLSKIIQFNTVAGVVGGRALSDAGEQQ